MSQQGINPPWLREESYEPLQQSTTHGPNNNFSSSTGKITGAADSRRSQVFFWVLKVTTMLLCLLMFITAIIGFGSINGVDSVGKIFIAVYMIFFSVLLFVFEAVEIKPIEMVDHMLRRNFGFLFSAMGKAFFIIFIAFLSFGLGDPELLSMITGTSLALFGFVEVALYLKYPELFEADK